MFAQLCLGQPCTQGTSWHKVGSLDTCCRLALPTLGQYWLMPLAHQGASTSQYGPCQFMKAIVDAIGEHMCVCPAQVATDTHRTLLGVAGTKPTLGLVTLGAKAQRTLAALGILITHYPSLPLAYHKCYETNAHKLLARLGGKQADHCAQCICTRQLGVEDIGAWLKDATGGLPPCSSCQDARRLTRGCKKAYHSCWDMATSTTPSHP